MSLDFLTEPKPPDPRVDRPHVMVVTEGDEEGWLDLQVEHYEDCPTETCGFDEDGTGNCTWTEYRCAVGAEEGFTGLDDHFDFYVEDISRGDFTEVIRYPGRYWIEHWSETHHGFDYTEYSGGLRLVYPEEAWR